MSLGEIRPTRRGWTVWSVVVGATVLASTTQSRALPAVILGGVVVLSIGIVHLTGLDYKTLERVVPPPAHAGTAGRVSIRLELNRRSIVRIGDRPPAELDPHIDARPVTATGPLLLDYTINRPTRGAYQLSPPRVVCRDPFGLVERILVGRRTDRLLVYPPALPLDGTRLSVRSGESTRDAPAIAGGRFDRLDEYRPGDPLRHVHWPASARQADDSLIVKRFARPRPQAHSSVRIGIDGPTDHADQLVAAGTSIVVAMAESGRSSIVITADEPSDHQSDPLSTLAMTDAGHLDAAATTDADLLVQWDDDTDTILIDTHDRTIPYDSLRIESDERGAAATRILEGG